MLESDFNSIVVRSLKESNGYGYKIPDTFSIYTKQRSQAPYDLFGYSQGKFICCESKWLPKPQAFNLNRLEDHQIENLIKAYEILRENCISLFLIGVDFGRNDKRVFYWKNKDLYIIQDRKINKNNILKKEFESLHNFLPIKKGLFEISNIINEESL